MMRTTAATLSLSDAELRIVLDAAHNVPPVWRSRYLEAVADQSMSKQTIDTATVRSAVTIVLDRMRTG